MLRILIAATLAAFAASATPAAAQQTQSAIFAGGCFWCIESDMDKVPGVTATTSGYSGGTLANPTYPNHEGHREVLKVDFDPSKVSYAQLVDIFFRSVDPTDAGGQFCDRGHAYTTAVYAANAEQKQAAEKAKAIAQAELGKPVVTPVEMAGTFWPAEEYHQDYYKKNPIRYRYYRAACGRTDRVKTLWGNAAYQGIPAH
ncbi:peptide-methionine (S)-S-oxide reductase [Aquibium carbonis]|uniref:Peptide methionine sulfoxide reductase MsrA n=1 Tax=Aquibium carbonis TaxID=2495581 RepID=A0A429Z3R3_9HYPH|nr:peptide-methionine (S)-S-oxide reductase MsrA [Aquibium carbonis]RST88353.1 peptide-methionine (S)-S-oxide reductase [Aquibium carbonis]